MNRSGICFFSNRAMSTKYTLVGVLLALGIVGCSIFEQSVRTSIDRAVSSAVEQELGARLAGYTDVMMYQLAYTQAFFMGGYGFTPGEFEEGQGATWRVEAINREEVSSYTAERALLKRYEDGSTWWYLKFDADDAKPMEYEVLHTADFAAVEMYVRDPESAEVRHHEFTFDEEERAEVEEGDESIEEIGYMTGHFYTESWDPYRQDREWITTEAGRFEADLLHITPQDVADYQDLQDGEGQPKNVEYRWWVTQDVPGDLVRFEYRDLNDGGVLRGELLSLRDDYRARFADL